MRSFPIPIATAAVFALLLTAASHAQSPGVTDTPGAVLGAETLYVNGRIYTVDPDQPWVEAVAVKDGAFLAVGSTEQILKLAGVETKRVDLQGRMVMPGIVDLHVHPFVTPIFNFINLDFSDPTDPERMMAELKAFAEAHPEKPWIRAGSWGVGVFPNNSPTKEMLDAAVPDRPAVLIDQTGHAYWLNSKALELSGITSETPTDALTIIDKDPTTGEPRGTVRESTLRRVEQAAAQPTPDELRKGFAGVFQEFSSKGVTTMQTAEGNNNYLDVVQAMERAGELPMRLFIGWDWHTHQTTPFTDAEMDAQIAGRAKYASEMVNPNFVKIFLDGTPDGHAVPFVEPYSDGSGKHGRGKISAKDLEAIVVGFDAMGVGVFMHSIGDGSARNALDAIEAARTVNGNTGVRHKVAHLVWVHPDDIPRFASIPDVAAEISPAATYPTPAFESYRPLVGEARYQRIFPAGSLLAAGARLGYGSDWLTLIPPSPWLPMQGFITRANPEHPEKGVLNESERITLEQALRVFTIHGAYAVGAEDRIGSIEAGKRADMIVLDRNLFEIEPTDIRNTKVLQTVLNGEVVWDAAAGEAPDVIDEALHEDAGRTVH